MKASTEIICRIRPTAQAQLICFPLSVYLFVCMCVVFWNISGISVRNYSCLVPLNVYLSVDSTYSIYVALIFQL